MRATGSGLRVAVTNAQRQCQGPSGRRLPPFLLERFDGWNDATYSLSSSECEPLSLQELLNNYAADDTESLKRWKHLSLGYVEPSSGSAWLKRDILDTHFRFHNRQAHQDSPLLDCVNVCAPQEGIFLAIQALCEPGDHVIVTSPAYQSLAEIARSVGCEVTEWWPEFESLELSTASSNGIGRGITTTVSTPRFCPQRLQSLLRPNNTKLVIANFPHNPTGALPSLQDYGAMVEALRNNNNDDTCESTWFLVDEMYRGLEHGASSSSLPTAADVMGDRGISLGGVSKIYGLPGLRIGWLVSQSAALMQRVAELKDYTTICPPAPCEVLASMALRAHTRLLERSRSVVAHNLSLLRTFCVERNPHYLEWCEPLGGTFAWVRLKSETRTASEFSQTLRQRTGLMVVSSGLFPECSDQWLRLTYGRRGLDDLLAMWQQDLDQRGT